MESLQVFERKLGTKEGEMGQMTNTSVLMECM